MSLHYHISLTLALLVFFFSGIDAAVLVEGNADTQDIDEKQRSRFVRREPGMGESLAEGPRRAAHLSPEDDALQDAKEAAVEAAGLKAATEVHMQKEVAAMKVQVEEADEKRLKAEAVVEALETTKAKAEQMMFEKAKEHKTHYQKTKDQKTTPRKNTGDINFLADQAKLKAKEAEKIKFESFHKAIRSRMGLGVASKETKKEHKAKEVHTAEKVHKANAGHKSKYEIQMAAVSGLPEFAFSSEAYFVDKETHYANLMKVISERQKAEGESEDEEGSPSWCRLDYPLGIWNTSQCSEDGAVDDIRYNTSEKFNYGKHHLIADESTCIQAAIQANSTYMGMIPPEWQDLHPARCFVFPCHWDPGHVCYFYNEIGTEPLYPWGAPVCQRPLFLNGTEDTNSGCPDGYDVIMDENNCTTAAFCESYCVEQNYLVGVAFPIHNASQHDIYPEGCFIHKEQGCVYFNPMYGQNPPQNPIGTPLCNVTQITHFPETKLPWDVFW